MPNLKEELYHWIRLDERAFQLIQESPHNGIWCFNLSNMNEQWLSDSFLTSLGYRRSENKCWQELAEFEAVAILQKRLDAFERLDGYFYEQEIEYIHKSGTLIKTANRAILIRHPDSQMMYLVGIMRKVSSQKHPLFYSNTNLTDTTPLLITNKMSTHLTLATKAAKIGIWEYDLVSGNLLWDDQMLVLYGINAEDFGGKYEDWSSRVHPDDILVNEQAIKTAVDTKNDFDIEFRIIFSDGTIRHIKSLAKIHYNIMEEPALMIGANWDVTDERLGEKKLKEAKAQAEAASKAKSEFLANMSHEIRTPLNGVIGFTDLLLESELNTTQYQYLSNIYQSATSLLDIINNVLDLSKIEAGKLDVFMGKTDLLALCHQVISLVRYQAQRKHLKIILNIAEKTPRFVWIDEVKVRQVLVNLLSNAIKFTDEGEVELKIASVTENTPTVLLKFAVRDTGIGIAPKNQHRIFAAFAQGRTSTTRKQVGTGLGLSISNKLLALMGTQLHLESEERKGSTFYFDMYVQTLDDAIIESNKLENEVATNNSNYVLQEQVMLRKPITILVVEDNDINRELIKAMIVSLMPQALVREAQNGKGAIDICKQEKPDLIFMDIQMPEMDGYKTSLEIREISGRESLPIIALTAGTLKGEKEKCLASGMNDYISKPIIKEAFVELIDLWVNKENFAQTQKHFDKEALLQIIGNNPKTCKKIADKALLYFNMVIIQIQKEIKQPHPEAIKQQAHALKGAAKSMYMPKLAELAECLEKLQSQDLHTKKKLVQEICQEINYVKTLLDF